MSGALSARPLRPLTGMIFASARWIGPVLLMATIGLPLACYFARFLLSPAGPLAAAYGAPGESARLGLVLLRTAAIAAMAATISLAFAIVFFCAFEPLTGRSRRLAVAAACLPLFIPGHFAAIAWIQAFGSAGWGTASLSGISGGAAPTPAFLYSPFGCAWVEAMHLYPAALALLLTGRRGIPAAAIESAATQMRPGALWRKLLSVWLRRWLAIGALAVFIMALLDYAIPSLLRSHVFAVEIMTAYDIHYDATRAIALALPLLATSLAAAVALGLLLIRCGWPDFAEPTVALPRLARPATLAWGTLAAAALAASLLLPLAGEVRVVRGWSDIRAVLITARPQAAVSLTACSLATGFALLLALLLTAPPGTLPPVRRRLLDGAMLLCFAIPGSLAGMAHLTFWNEPALGGLLQRVFDSGLMLPLGLATLFLPIGYAALRLRLRETPPDLLDQERLAPARSMRRWARLTLPCLARPASAAGMLIFVLAMQEVHGTILLAAPGQETLSVRAMTLLHYAPDGLVAAFCLLTLAVMAGAIALAWSAGLLIRRLARRWSDDCAFD